jgi:hypothetical protein
MAGMGSGLEKRTIYRWPNSLLFLNIRWKTPPSFEAWWKFIGETKWPRWKVECLLDLLLANSCKKTFTCLCKHYLRCKPHLWKQHYPFVDERSWMWTKEVCATIFIPHGSWPYEQWMQRCHMLNHVPLYTTWTFVEGGHPLDQQVV